MKKGYSLRKRTVAMVLLLVFIFNLFAPNISWAVSSGPSQAEFNGYTAGDVTELVDPFTGDFSYNIPLMTVPGTDGGYPLVLSYNAGVSMNDEASWVGLGWSLNPGVVNRSMRGVPDDFNGDIITQKNDIRPNTTVELRASTDLAGLLPEVYGFDGSLLGIGLPISYGFYYNTYTGLGTNMSAGLSMDVSAGMFGGSMGLGMNFDSNEGASAQGSVSLSAQLQMLSGSAGIGGTYSARNGITSVMKTATFGLSNFKNPLYGVGGTFSTSSIVPVPPYKMTGMNAALKFDFEAGAFSTEINIPIAIEGSYSSNKIAQTSRDLQSRGYMYLHNSSSSDQPSDEIMDFNRENDRDITMKSPFVPNPIATQDIYALKGIGGGAAFRLYRNDAGLFHDPTTISSTGGGTVGFEVAASTGFKVAADIDVNYTESYTGKWQDGLSAITPKLKFRGESEFATQVGSVSIRKEEPYSFRFMNENTRMLNAAQFISFRKEAPYQIGIGMAEKSDQSLDGGMGEFISEIASDIKPVFVARALNQSGGQPIPEYKKTKEIANTVITHRTAAEVIGGGSSFPTAKCSTGTAITASVNNNYFSSLSAFNYSQSHIKPHHVSEFTIVQEGGEIQKYAIPVYNRKQNDHYFSYGSSSGSADNMTPQPTISKSATDYPGSYEKFYHGNAIPAYAHSYLLTEIYSPDYIDVTNDGPSNDDYGDFTKFNYIRTETNFKWRVPYSGAVNQKGNFSVPYDNKASYTYGEKELWYVQSIETKTHVAFFITSDRKDGSMVADENSGGRATTGNKLKKLDRIMLFSKSELKYAIDNGLTPTALQQVFFRYSYDLCPNVPSNDMTNSGTNHPDKDINPSLGDENANRGKLTLEKIEIVYGNSTKGQLTPYRFNYGTTSEENPAYVFGHQDRWGTYRNLNRTVNTPLGGPALRSSDETFPYVHQLDGQKAILDKEAGAWCLKEIIKPSGGKINIEYEADDYSHVQDQKAQQMFKIVGVGKHGEHRHNDPQNAVHKQTSSSKDNMFILGDNNLPMNKNNTRIYFEPETPISSSLSDAQITEAVKKYMGEVQGNGKALYFKTWQRLQIPKHFNGSPDWVYDYVEGYSEVGSYGYVIHNGNTVIPYVVVENVTVKGRTFHPFKLAGLQYLRYQRGDLSQMHGVTAYSAVNTILGTVPLIVGGLEMLAGYYNWAIMRGHCEQMGNQEASYIKLQSPDGIKFGGGHRVKSVTVNDVWGDQTAEAVGNASYKENYYYRTWEGREVVSSGVAAYEPIVGGEENALKKPVYFQRDNKFANKEMPFFQHLPVLEALYPAPTVGYRDINVVTNTTESNPETGDGFARYTFYTHKEYPIYSYRTDPPQRLEEETGFVIPLIGSLQYKTMGYSQGYSIVLNDMHGKPRAEFSYPSTQWNSNFKTAVDYGAFRTKTEYVYNIDNSQMIESFKADFRQGNRTSEPLNGYRGLDYEMYADVKENFVYSINGGAAANVGVDPLPYAFFGSGFPAVSFSIADVRTIATTKVVYRSSFVKEIISTDVSNEERMRNLLYDMNSGDVVLSQVTSDWDKTGNNQYDDVTYTLESPAYIETKYAGMGQAYFNNRLYFTANVNAGMIVWSGAASYLSPGDELYCISCGGATKKYWVNEVTPDVFIIDRNGALAPNGSYTFRVMRSGKRNMQSAPASTIESLQDPSLGGNYAVFDYYNRLMEEYLATGVTPAASMPFDVTDCMDKHYKGTMVLTTGSSPAVRFNFTGPGKACPDCIIPCRTDYPYVEIPVSPSQGATLAGFRNIRFYALPSPTGVRIDYLSGASSVTDITGANKYCEMERCYKGVLNADATEYSDDHLYAAADYTLPSINRYAAGRKGVWRVLRTNAYITDRIQSNPANPNPDQYQFPTFAGKDGEYKAFVEFDHAVGNFNDALSGKGWRWVTEVPGYGYSPDGDLLMSKNRLNQLSSNLYDYNRLLPVMQNGNANMRELGFTSFETTSLLENIAGGGSNVQLTVPTRFSNFIIIPATTGNEKTYLSKYTAHSGRQSIFVDNQNFFSSINIPVMVVPDENSFQQNNTSNPLQIMDQGKKYVFSAWCRNDVAPEDHGNAGIVYFQWNGVTYTWTVDPQIQSAPEYVDGWRKVEFVFSYPGTLSSAVTQNLTVISVVKTYIDDIRIQPYESESKTVTYNPRNYLPKAELDASHYMTKISYDEENKPVVIKKESSKGMYSVSTSRTNTARK